jgi:hypothetical protein
MNWTGFQKPLFVQLVGHAALAGVIWYWLGLGVSSVGLVAANGFLALLVLLGYSLLSAYGLGEIRCWYWALLAVLLTPWMASHVVLALLIPFALVIVLLPSAASGKPRVLAGASYLGVCAGIFLGMTVVPMALLGWIPKLNGLGLQLTSFGLRATLSFVVFAGGWAILLRHIGDNAKR